MWRKDEPGGRWDGAATGERNAERGTGGSSWERQAWGGGKLRQGDGAGRAEDPDPFLQKQQGLCAPGTPPVPAAPASAQTGTQQGGRGSPVSSHRAARQGGWPGAGWGAGERSTVAEDGTQFLPRGAFSIRLCSISLNEINLKLMISAYLSSTSRKVCEATWFSDYKCLEQFYRRYFHLPKYLSG